LHLLYRARLRKESICPCGHTLVGGIARASTQHHAGRPRGLVRLDCASRTASRPFAASRMTYPGSSSTAALMNRRTAALSSAIRIFLMREYSGGELRWGRATPASAVCTACVVRRALVPRARRSALTIGSASLLLDEHTEGLHARGPVCPVGEACSVHSWWLDCDERWQPLARQGRVASMIRRLCS
jgi:hypothetical protein